MSRRPVVEVEGLRALRRSLKAAGQSLDKEFKDVHAAVARVVVVAAIPRTPVGPDSGGHIRDDVRGTGQAAAAVVRAGRSSRPYGGILHYGDPHRGIKAQPWLYDAAVATRDVWLALYERGLTKIIDKVEGAPGP
jgi:hypothetical protein